MRTIGNDMKEEAEQTALPLPTLKPSPKTQADKPKREASYQRRSGTVKVGEREVFVTYRSRKKT